MNVIVMKMANGDEVIAALVSEEINHLVVDRPRVLKLNQDASGNVNGALVPYLVTDPERKNVTFSKNYMVTHYLAGPELSKGYTQTVSSIQLLS